MLLWAVISIVNKLPVTQMQQVSGVNACIGVVDVDCGEEEETSSDGEERKIILFVFR